MNPDEFSRTNDLDLLKRQMQTTNVRNADNHQLQPVGGTAHVGWVNGPDAFEEPEYVPTKFELDQLASCWASMWIRLDLECLSGGIERSTEWIYQKAFIARRLRRIATLMGGYIVESSIDTACDCYSRYEYGYRLVRIVRYGTDTEFSRVAEVAKLPEDSQERKQVIDDVLRQIDARSLQRSEEAQRDPGL